MVDQSRYVNPTNINDIHSRDLVNNELLWDVGGQYQLPDGIHVNPKEAQNVYRFVPDTTECGPPPQYYIRSTTQALDPPVIGQVGAVVKETALCTQVSLQALYNLKMGELDQYATQVFDSAFQLNLDLGTKGTEWWVSNAEMDRSARASYNGTLANEIGERYDALQKLLVDTRQAGIDDTGGTNAEIGAWWAAYKAAKFPTDWWQKDIRVFLYRRSDLKLATENLNKTQWQELCRAESTFGWQARNAANRVFDDISAAYKAGDWTQLAAIDVAAASYNWPTHYQSPPEPRLGSTGPA